MLSTLYSLFPLFTIFLPSRKLSYLSKQSLQKILVIIFLFAPLFSNFFYSKNVTKHFYLSKESLQKILVVIFPRSFFPFFFFSLFSNSFIARMFEYVQKIVPRIIISSSLHLKFVKISPGYHFLFSLLFSLFSAILHRDRDLEYFRNIGNSLSRGGIVRKGRGNLRKIRENRFERWRGKGNSSSNESAVVNSRLYLPTAFFLP